jgi:hypothetical protein
MASTNNRSLLKRITPECENFASRSTTINTISVLFALATVILLIIALVYNYMPTADEPVVPSAGNSAQQYAGKNTRKQNVAIVGTLNIIALFTIAATLLIGFWSLAVQKQLKTCIDQSPSQ